MKFIDAAGAHVGAPRQQNPPFDPPVNGGVAESIVAVVAFRPQWQKENPDSGQVSPPLARSARNLSAFGEISLRGLGGKEAPPAPYARAL